MLPAFLYQHLYLLLVTVCTIFCSIQYYNDSLHLLPDVKKSQHIGGWLFVILLAFFIGYRPVSAAYFGDTYNYDLFYKVFNYGKAFNWKFEGHDLVYENMINWFGSQRYTFFLLLRLLRMGVYNEAKDVIESLRNNGVYPIRHFIGKDYNGIKLKMITACLNNRQLFLALCRINGIKLKICSR